MTAIVVIEDESDIADLLEQLADGERRDLLRLWSGTIDGEILSELDESIREEVLAELPDDFREPLVLRDVAGLDYAEIADVLDIPPGTVRSRIARARGRLATQLSSDVGHTSRSREPDDGLDSSKTTT